MKTDKSPIAGCWGLAVIVIAKTAIATQNGIDWGVAGATSGAHADSLAEISNLRLAAVIG